ncbi:MAG: DUF1566 domain-containing protein [Prevotellaceae bacterium]|jgi:hypothetical protein|nr:DUF1566 domain-containing protein [Prevotellaceae bacterium]
MKQLTLIVLLVFVVAFGGYAQATQGGGLYLNNSSAENTLVIGNKSTGEGTGVYAEGTGTVTNATIANNQQVAASRFDAPVKVGDVAGGGVVFYVDEGTRAVYVVSPSEDNDKAWGKYGVTNSLAVDLYDGSENTKAIVDSQVVIAQISYNFNGGGTATIPADTLKYATQWCVGLSDGGQTDWYLPAREQLKQLFAVKAEVNAKLSTMAGATSLGNGYYWSSSEEGSYSAWYVFFDTGEVNIGEKINRGGVRAIRQYNY